MDCRAIAYQKCHGQNMAGSKVAWMIALGKEVMIALEEPAGEQGGKQWL